MALADRIKEAIEGAERPDGTPKIKAEIARECGVTAGAVSQWLSGETKSLKADTALALEQSTGYRANWILHGKGPKKLTDPVMYWPFRKLEPQRFEVLDEGDQGYVERRLIQAIEECEGGEPPPSSKADTESARRDLDMQRAVNKTTSRRGNKRAA